MNGREANMEVKKPSQDPPTGKIIITNEKVRQKTHSSQQQMTLCICHDSL